ncbi:hypothetical protein [Desulfotomaculum copahuensis]|uniref:hypothetical protein n=1 Tax=Desulfotomaculum copahuensis TaxID=1838280 RepID=UPI001246FD99|nr:hypothetical protein [Desulfotomaculum copahuensis]
MFIALIIAVGFSTPWRVYVATFWHFFEQEEVEEYTPEVSAQIYAEWANNLREERFPAAVASVTLVAAVMAARLI